jgi:dienelactone hydrolase
MTHIALFHSVYGLRPAVLAAAERFRAAGHEVVTPDLYDGEIAATVEDGFAINKRIGWPTIAQRARDAVRGLPADAVLAGFSMGAGVAGSLLAERPGAGGLLLLHGIAGDPATMPAGLPVQVHIADPDEYDPPADVSAWQAGMNAVGTALEVFTYPGAGHLFTDPELADYDPAAAEAAWQRSLEFLAAR